MPVKIPTVQTGLEASIQAAAKKAGRNLKINMGGNAKSIEGLSQPLGRITGKADQFTKSMEAANARVLAFGASVGILAAVTRGFENLIKVTIEVEKSLTSINSILNVSTQQLESFKNTIFDVARNTEQSFSTVAQAALELSRQGLKAEEVTKRLNDAMILSRLSSIGASESVAGLTAAINSFNKSGITSAQVLNKLSAAAISAAVSERDLIEGIKRSGSVATQAGVSFDELVGIITAVQAKTARGGAVIGNSFKTIFTRIQSIEKLKTMQNLGVEVTNASGQVLGATKLIQNLGKSLENVPDASRLQIAEGLVGKFQVSPFLAILDDYTSKNSIAIKATEKSQKAFSEAYDRNEAQNATLSAAINRTTVSVAQFAEALGKIGVTDNLKSLLGFFSSVVEDITGIFDGDSLGAKFAKGIVAGIGNIITGPGLAIFVAIIGKLAIDLVKFGAGSLKTFFGLNKAAQAQANLQGQIASTLLGNSTIQKQILAIENSTLSVEQKRVAQTAFFTTALNEQMLIMTRMQGIASKISPFVLKGIQGGKSRAAGGFIPNFNAIVGYGSEKSDISKGVGGAPASAKPVTIPNFNFGGGQKGTMVANSSEYIVPNYAGGDGSAVFNQDMAASIGLPSGARKIGAAGGYIPNFATALGAFKKTYGLGKINPANRSTFFKPDGTPATDKVKGVLKDHPNSPEAKALIAVRGKIYNANRPQKSVMLIPQEAPFQPSAANHRFQKPYKGFNQFLGGVAGINPALNEKNSKFAKLLKLDSVLDDSLADAVNVALNKAIGQGAGSLKAKPKSYSAKEIKNLVLAEGGGGAFGAMRGAMFEGIMKAITGGVSQGNEGKLDAVFDSNRKVLEEVFGLENQNFEFGDFKNSVLSKDKYARQVITNVPKAAAAGYIPNYAGGLQDAIQRESAAGLPVNQIRVNQSPKLRNAGNPMGLAVTNTRDEPTGAIPNFAKKATPDQATDAMGGFLGKLFAVQIGMSALSGVLGEVTEKNKGVSVALTAFNLAISAAMVGQAFGGVKGAISVIGGAKGAAMKNTGAGMRLSGRLANQRLIRSGAPKMGGLKMLKNSAKIVGGVLTTFGGALSTALLPIAAVAAAAYGLSKWFDFTSGTTETLEKNQIRLAASAKSAAKELSELKIEDKAGFVEENQGIADKFKARLTERGFVGNEDKQQASDIAGLIKNAFDAGATEKQVESIIGRAERDSRVTLQHRGGGSYMEDTVFTNATSEKMNESLKVLANMDFSGIQDKFIQSITEKEKLAIAGKLTPEENLKKKEEVISRGRGITGLSLAALQGGLKGAKEEGSDVFKNIDKVKIDTAKAQLSMEIELMKLRAQALTFDEKTLALAKRNNSLSQVGIVKLQHKIALSKEDVTINSSLADVIQSQVNKEGSGVVLDQTEITAVAEAFAKADLGDLSNVEKRNALLKQTLKTLGKSEDSIKASQGLMDATVLKVIQEGDQRKLNLGYTQKQALLDAERAEYITNISKTLATASFRQKTENTVEIGNSQRKLNRDKQSFSINNPFVSAAGAAKAEKGFVDRQSAINIEEKDNQVVEETKGTLLGLIKTMPNLGHEIKEVIKSIEGAKDIGKAFAFLDKVAGLETNDTKPPNLFFGEQFSARGIPPLISRPVASVTTDAKNDGDEAKAKLERLQKEKEALARDEKLKGDMAGKGVIMAGAFKMYSQLLTEFTNNLRGEAESLKLSLLTVKDGASAISNIDDQLFKKAAGAGGPVATARASDAQALRGATDQITLARTSVDRRAAIKNKDILAKELDIKTEIAVKQKDGITKEKDLLALRRQLVELEKKRLAIGTSRAELFENEFVFTQEEIQEGLDKALVQNARTFVDTISDGLVNAISKGQDLGDTLRQAGAEFFNSMAQDNMKAAFDNITSSSFVKDIASRFGGNKKAAGGKVTGGSGSKDDVPALLMGGEFVMRKSSVQKYGPSFMESLNSGKIPAMARGGLFTPGTYGQEEIKGKSNLIDFATQSFTSGASDKFGSGSGFASVGLEPQSAALTMFGRRNSPAFKKEQDSKKEAFGLFLQQVKKEEEARKQKKEAKKAFKNALVSAAAGAAFKGLTGLFSDPDREINNKNNPARYTESGYEMTATGGAIPNKAGVDTVPAMLSGGEFVMNAAATQKIGAGNLNALNSGAGGGSEDIVSKLDELISVSDNAGETVINITVNSDGSSDTQGGGDDQQQSLATKIKDVVKQVINDEKRLGGSLRQARA